MNRIIIVLGSALIILNLIFIGKGHHEHYIKQHKENHISNTQRRENEKRVKKDSFSPKNTRKSVGTKQEMFERIRHHFN